MFNPNFKISLGKLLNSNLKIITPIRAHLWKTYLILTLRMMYKIIFN